MNPAQDQYSTALERANELAATGSDSIFLAAIAAGLVLIGFWLWTALKGSDETR